MLFNSYLFVLVFLPISVWIYYSLNAFKLYKISLVVLAVFSLCFYGFNNWKYVFLLIASIIINWGISKVISNNFCTKFFLIVGIMLNITNIFYFKYYNFLISNVNSLAETNIKHIDLILPLGISFYTFQQISYLVDSYRGETKNYTFLEYVAFVSFFPQLVAGPWRADCSV